MPVWDESACEQKIKSRRSTFSEGVRETKAKAETPRRGVVRGNQRKAGTYLDRKEEKCGEGKIWGNWIAKRDRGENLEGQCRRYHLKPQTENNLKQVPGQKEEHNLRFVIPSSVQEKERV